MTFSFNSTQTMTPTESDTPSPGDSLFERHASLLCPVTLGEIRRQFQLDWLGFHGVAHWARVLENGLNLCCGVPEARADVVVLFALFHDSCRRNEHRDPEHGERAALLAESYFEKGRLPVDALGLQLLSEACRGHDQGRVSSDATIGVCWDADRLDLARVGILPSVRFLSTEAAKNRDLLERCVNASRSGEFPRRAHWDPVASTHSP
jgi:uncharacterized protein